MALSLFFLTVAAIFAALSVRDYFTAGPAMTPARKTWMIIFIIFTLVGILLWP